MQFVPTITVPDWQVHMPDTGALLKRMLVLQLKQLLIVHDIHPLSFVEHT